jgi:hypothetical protein
MTTIVEVPHKITEQWLFSEEDIKNSPSALHGLDPAEERSRRAKGVNFIVQAGILLKIPQLTLGTASVFFHRFFMRASMIQEKGGVHHYVSGHPGMAALLLVEGMDLRFTNTEYSRDGPISGHESRGEHAQNKGNSYCCCQSRPKESEPRH